MMMQVRDVVSRTKGSNEVVTILEHADVTMAASRLLRHHIGGLVVVDENGRLQGFLSERDVVRAVHMAEQSAGRTKVRDVMQHPAPTCSVNDDLEHVAMRMNRERHRHLVVTDGDQIVGVLSVGDLVKHRLVELELEAGVLRDYISGQRARRA